MKKILTLAACTLLAALCILSASAYEFAAGSDAVVYVNGSANDANDGLTADTAVATLAHATELLAGKNGGTVVVCGKVSVPAAFAPASVGGAVLYTSVFGGTDYRTAGAELEIGANMTFANATFFDDVNLSIAKGSLIFTGNCNDFGFGKGAASKSANGSAILFPILVGGVNSPLSVADASNDKSYTLTVAGGTWQGLMGGNRRASASNAVGVLSGDVRVIIEGGTFDKGAGSQYVSAGGANYHTGTLTMEITGGTFNTSLYVFRKLGTLPSVAAMNPAENRATGSTARTLVRIDGGTFTNNMTTAGEKIDAAYIPADIAIYITGGNFNAVNNIYNWGTEGSTVIYTTPEIEKILEPKVQTSFYFSNDLSGNRDKTETVHFSGKMSELPDPYVVEKDGVYYYCFSSNGVKVAKSTEMLFGHPTYNSVNVYKPEYSNIANAKKEFWAPELHYFSAEEVGAADAGWYIYVAADNGSDVNHRMYVLRARDPEDALSRYDMVGELKLDGDKWAIDGTILKYNGKIYMVWSGRAANNLSAAQNLYIQELSNPYTATGTKVMLAAPDKGWETQAGSHVNEGPQILQVNGTTHIIYSANGSWTQYYLLTALTLTGDDPLNIKSWTETDGALFQSSGKNSMYGTGHASFVQNVLDGTYWIYYHANKSLTVPSGSSWWAERDTYLQQFTIEEKELAGKTYSFPSFGLPLPVSADREITVRTPDYADPNAVPGVTLKMTVNSTTASVNGVSKVLDAAPIIRFDRTMLPVRFVAENLGATVAWDGATSTATLTAEGITIEITIGAETAKVNGEDVKLDSPAFIENSRTYLPVRFVAEKLGATVTWDGATSTATIKK